MGRAAMIAHSFIIILYALNYPPVHRRGREHSNTRNPRLGSREHPSGLPDDARTSSGGKGYVAAGADFDLRPQAFLGVFGG